MLRKMDIIMSDEHSLEDKVSAFDDFEMLIENLDNANNMENLGLWTKLVDQLEHEEDEIRKYAAWCTGTAVENNARAQERVNGRFADYHGPMLTFAASCCRRNTYARQARDRGP